MNKQALQFALKLEEAHLALLRAGGSDFWGSEAEIAMGNKVFTMCMASGVDLEDDNGYCNKATGEEICEYNIGRIKAALASAPMNVRIENGIATLPDGTEVHLLQIQAMLNAAFQEHGDLGYAEAANRLSLITQRWQGPHGEFLPGTYLDN